MAAQSSSGNGLETFYSFAPDVHNLLEQDTYPSFPEGGQTRPGSLPSLDFASSAYVESHSSTGACSPVHYEMSYSNEIYGPPQHADVMNPTNVSAPNDIGSVPCPSLHLPGCPSAAPYHHPPHLQSLIPHGPPPMTACAHAYDPRHAIEAWQSAQHSQRNQASYCPQHHPRVTHSTVLQSQGTNAQCSHDSQGISSQAQEQRQAWTSEAVQKQSSSYKEGSQLSKARTSTKTETDHYKASDYGTSPTPSSINPDTSSMTDAERAHGRHSHHYAAQPHKSDGLYHCAFEGNDDCPHQPAKLKCNYDKYIDSHLKPYRCNAKGCEDLHFSSTACRLRHEREAHGSHGHGHKPYPCLYEGCNRARPENGFPRSWNRRDHMTRVHGFIIPAESEDNDSPCEQSPELPPLTPTISKSTVPQKRASVVATKSKTSSKRQKPATKSASLSKPIKQKSKTPDTEGSAIADVDRHQQLHDEWRSSRLRLQQYVHNLQGPNDKNNLQLVDSEVQALTKISHVLGS